jgi:hypothetical protein
MTWRGPTTPRDELLGTYTWRVRIRKYWMARRLPCAVCHRAIDYDGPRFLPGTRKVNPRALVVGHIVGRYQAKQLGWTQTQINSINNTRPECVACSNKSGQRLGAQVQRSRRKPFGLTDAHRW